MMEPETPGGCWNPGSGTLGPLDQYGVSFGDEPFPIEVGRFIGGSEAKTIEMEHRPSGSLVAMHQCVRGAGGRRCYTEAAHHRLDERGLPCPQVAFEGDQCARWKRSAEGLSLGVKLAARQGESHACRRTLVE